MAGRVRTVESAAATRVGDVDCWQVITRAKGDGGITHLFPKSTLEWRAAEYGIDPTDVDGLLDVVLHEQLFDEDTAVKAQHALQGARSTADARAGHLARIAALKEQHRVAIEAGGPLDVIRARPGISPDGVRAKREAVDVHRWTQMYGGLPVPVLSSSQEVPRA